MYQHEIIHNSIICSITFRNSIYGSTFDFEWILKVWFNKNLISVSMYFQTKEGSTYYEIMFQLITKPCFNYNQTMMETKHQRKDIHMLLPYYVYGCSYTCTIFW